MRKHHRGPGTPDSKPVSGAACVAILALGLFMKYWWLILIILVLYILVLIIFNS
jgi:hypothetical protein